MDIFFISKRIFMDEENEFIDGGILVTQEGQIREILRTPGDVNSYLYANESDEVFDFGDKILMPGLIDSHVHINEPGRKDWEGFTTATKAAAAGGFTTIIDMPLNSIPPTTTVENLRAKTSLARGKIFVDVAFWGGLIPDNIDDLEPLVRNGVVGFKCFLCPSGVEEFPHVNRQQVEMAYEKLQGSGSVLAFHAELEPPEPIAGDDSQPKKYSSYLSTRPPSMEVNAIQMIADLAPKYNVRTHIVHLSTAEAIPMIRECKKNGAKLTVETCHHYLSLSSEEILDSHTEFKCAPPIRDLANQELLWKAIVEQDIDLLVSDHSPCTPGPKMLNYGRNRGNFLRAWGGIASNQFGLSLFWTKCRDYGMDVKDVHRLMCKKPAQLCGLSDRKGRIAVGYDADFCVWDPDEEFTVSDDIIQFKNKANPYMNKRLRGVVHATFVRGLHVYQQYEAFGQPLGQVIQRKTTKKIVKFT